MVKRILLSIDDLGNRFALHRACECPALIILLFHGLIKNRKELRSGSIDPALQYAATVTQLRQVAAYFCKHGYRFVSPQDILDGLPAGGRFAMLNFDDGYYNNTLALGVLEEFSVPAVFFVTTDNVLRGKCFWWDVQYRRRRSQGRSLGQIYAEQRMLMSRSERERETYLVEVFGAGAFEPEGDIDRPFTPSELCEFAAHPKVHIGNHAHRHVSLSGYPVREQRFYIQRCQQALDEMIGYKPVIIAYPSGRFSQQTVVVARQQGLRLGVSLTPGRNYLPLAPDDPRIFSLSRFVLNGNHPILPQLRQMRSDCSVYTAIKRIFRKTIPY
ncbi:MAG: polysaccharide deacetylase family protein [Candidatus Omnitrophica bacterium]|nr:polysaccharide deacetylase family protein [Candidatus Omnitrophota bacterium]